MLSEGNAAQPVGCDSPLQIVMMFGTLFVLIQTFWVGCDSPLLCAKKAILQTAVTQITQKNSLQREGVP
jgi:hypothetical protein